METLPLTQEELDAIIEKATSGLKGDLKSEREKRKTFETQLNDIQAKLGAADKAAKEAQAAKERQELEGKGKYEEALKKAEETYTAKLAELQTKLDASGSRVKALVVDGEILKHAADAVDPQDVLALIKGNYQFEVTDSGVAVKKSDGTPLLDASGKPGGIDIAVKQFLDSKPHLVKAGGQGGAGSRGGTHQQPASGDIDAQIAAAQKAGNRQLVIKLKAQKMSLQGPHSMRKAV